MITVTRTYTRLATNINWHGQAGLPDKSAFTAHIKTTYIDTGKCLIETTTASPDGLQVVYSANWHDRAAYDEYDTDPANTTFWAQRDEYCAMNNITMSAVEFT